MKMSMSTSGVRRRKRRAQPEHFKKSREQSGWLVVLQNTNGARDE
jgi:hypothetical protein